MAMPSRIALPFALALFITCGAVHSSAEPPSSSSTGDGTEIGVVDDDVKADVHAVDVDIGVDDGDADGREAEEEGDKFAAVPPSHHRVAAHVQTNLRTGVSYFVSDADLDASYANLPYLECGAIGSTTESLALVSGVFRHVPHAPHLEGGNSKRREELEGLDVDWDQVNVQATEGQDIDGALHGEDGANAEPTSDGGDGANDAAGDVHHPKRPSPPRYIVALSPMEITVGGSADGRGSSNETRTFQAGDVIFVEDTWWGVWDAEEHDDDESDAGETSSRMRGTVIRAPPHSREDSEMLLLTVPNAVHRHWKKARYALAAADREERMQKEKRRQNQNQQSTDGEVAADNIRFQARRPSAVLTERDRQRGAIPPPCELESDPSFSRTAFKSTSLPRHFARHFANVLRRSSSHHHRHGGSSLSAFPSLLPVLAQTFAAVLGGSASLAIVLRLWKVVPTPAAVGFGSACLLVVGTTAFVLLGEEVLDQLELWRERRVLERVMEAGGL